MLDHVGTALLEGPLISGDPSAVVGGETTAVTIGGVVPVVNKIVEDTYCTASDNRVLGPSTSLGVCTDKDMIQEVELGGELFGII